MFYEKFVNLCVEHGVSPSAAAAAVGMTGAHVSRWKRGSTPTDATISKIASYFEVPTSYFDGQPENKKTPTVQTNDGLTNKQREFIDIIRELPDDIVSPLLSAAKDWINNRKSADSPE